MTLASRYITLQPREDKCQKLAWCMFIHQNTSMGQVNTDHQHLLRLRDLYVADRALPSSLTRMAEVLGFRSANAALKLCDRLCLAGVLRKGPGGKVMPTERFIACQCACRHAGRCRVSVVVGRDDSGEFSD